MDRIAPELLSPARRAAPPADDTVARMLAGASGSGELTARIAQINGELARWQTNGALASWRPGSGPGIDPGAAGALADVLPNDVNETAAWRADPKALHRMGRLEARLAGLAPPA
jgi:hypothetical protein